MRSIVPRAANVLGVAHTRATFAAFLQQVCTGIELSISVAHCTNRLVLTGCHCVVCAQRHRRPASDTPRRYTGARDTTYARSARNNWIPKREGYIHTQVEKSFL